jgi:hypothetical protein
MQNKNGSEWLGIVLLIITQLFARTQLITDDNILKTYYFDLSGLF